MTIREDGGYETRKSEDPWIDDLDYLESWIRIIDEDQVEDVNK
jgi:hypothetical protein